MAHGYLLLAIMQESKFKQTWTIRKSFWGVSKAWCDTSTKQTETEHRDLSPSSQTDDNSTIPLDLQTEYAQTELFKMLLLTSPLLNWISPTNDLRADEERISMTVLLLGEECFRTFKGWYLDLTMLLQEMKNTHSYLIWIQSKI